MLGLECTLGFQAMASGLNRLGGVKCVNFRGGKNLKNNADHSSFLNNCELYPLWRGYVVDVVESKSSCNKLVPSILDPLLASATCSAHRKEQLQSVGAFGLILLPIQQSPRFEFAFSN